MVTDYQYRREDGTMYQELTDCVIFVTVDIGDEFHYIMSCNYLKQERYSCKNVNIFKFNELFFFYVILY